MYFLHLTNVQHNKFYFSKTDFVLLSLILEEIYLLSNLKVKKIICYLSNAFYDILIFKPIKGVYNTKI